MGLIQYKKRAFTKRVILHDSHTANEYKDCGSVVEWASQARIGGLKMGLLSTGYHFIVERNGVTVPCRDIATIGSHTPGHNLDSIGVCLVGGREYSSSEGVDNFTSEQRKAFLELCLGLHEKYEDLRKPYLDDYSSIELVGHSEIQKYRDRTKPRCPPLDMDILRDDVALYINKRIVLND